MNTWDIFTGLSQAYGVHAKETEANIAEHAFLKGQLELLKNIECIFFESAFEGLSFHSFLNASD